MNRLDATRERDVMLFFDTIKLSHPYFTFIFIREEKYYALRKSAKANGFEHVVPYFFK